MSCSEDETSVASVLSQMSQLKQNGMDNEEHQGMNVAHQCDVETTRNCQQDFIEGLDEKVATSTSLEISHERQNTVSKTRAGVSSAKVFPCEVCGKEFNKSYNLKTHHRVHTGERPFSCPICAHGFANLGDLKRHARTHTGERPFICEFCNKAFSDFGSHKRHIRLHTGFKPFKCDQCDREFTRLDSFKNHTRLHSGQLPYKCEQCQKEFNYLTTYKRHLNIHSGQRPYSCETCGKKFTRLSYLKNHKSCHKNTAENQEKSNCEDLQTVNETTQKAAIDENEVIEPMARATFQQETVEVQSVVDGHSILIQTPSVDNDSIILGHDIIDHSANQVSFTVHTSSNDKDNLFIKDGTAQLYIAQQIFEENQTLNPSSYERITTGEFVDQTKTEQSLKQDQQCIGQEENAVYIAIEPSQNNVETVLEELRVAVVRET